MFPILINLISSPKYKRHCESGVKQHHVDKHPEKPTEKREAATQRQSSSQKTKKEDEKDREIKRGKARHAKLSIAESWIFYFETSLLLLCAVIGSYRALWFIQSDSPFSLTDLAVADMYWTTISRLVLRSFPRKGAFRSSFKFMSS